MQGYLLIDKFFFVQKLPKSLFVSCGIEPDEEGSAGLRLTARGSVTTCTYGVDTDGRTHLLVEKTTFSSGS